MFARTRDLGHLVNKLFYLSQEWGIIFTLKCLLDYTRFHTYSKINYPVADIQVKVRSMPFWKYLEAGRWEFECFRHIFSVLGSGKTVIDVGSWVGPYTLFFSKLVGPNGKVVSLEPNPRSFEILLDNLRANDISNVLAEKLCITDKVGEVNMWGPSARSSESTLRENRIDEFKKFGFRAKCTTLDNFCAKHHLAPDGIKIDVEGSEVLVLRGMSEIIEKYTPWVLLEFHKEFMSEEESIKTWDYLVRLAKRISLVEDNTPRVELRKIPVCQNFHIFIEF